MAIRRLTNRHLANILILLDRKRNKTMTYENYFPRGLAKGGAFCNREEERERLNKNIKSKQHTLIMSPRRYGKTSLVKAVAKETDLLFVETDLFVAMDAKHIEHQILMGIKKLIAEVSGSIEQTLSIMRDYFKKASTKWSVGTQGVNVFIQPTENIPTATAIMEGLSALEALLAKKKKRAIFFLDEVQTIGEVAEGKGIEGAIRHVAQEATYLSFVFSGSNRHLLTNMFYDKARPLYKLCDRLILDRIEEKHYKKHINKLSQKRWGEILNDTSFDMLFSLTERHPFYMNSLCLKLWESDLKSIPTAKDIKYYWHKLVTEERQEIAKELSMLNPGQRRILLAIARGTKKEFTGKEFIKTINMTGSSISKAVNLLVQFDYIEKLENGDYRLIDPLISTALRLYFDNNADI